MRKSSNTYSLDDIIEEINYYIFYVNKNPIKQYISLYEIDKTINNIVEQELIY